MVRFESTSVRGRGAIAVAAFLIAVAVGGAARGAGDDRAVAEALVKSTEPLGPAPVTADALARTSEALERATRLRAAGDEAHAKVADGLAREWAETARDLGLAAAAEKLAADRKRQSMQALAQLQRTKALVEEGIARLGRLRAALDAAAPPTKPKQAPAVDVHDGPAKPAREDPRGQRDNRGDKAAPAAGGVAP